LAMEDIKQIKNAIELRMNEINTLIVRASDIISIITGYTSIALSPNLTKAILKTIQIIPVDERKALIIVVTGGGTVKNQLIRFEEDIPGDALVKMTNYLQGKMNGLLIEKIKFPVTSEVCQEIGFDESTAGCILNGLVSCLQGIEKSEVIMNGTTNLLNHPEFNDLIKAKEVFDLLNEQEIIKTVMNAAIEKHDLNVMIGKENQLEPMHDCSLITATYSLGETDVGALGVIGPTRMSYARVVSAMKYMKKLINREILRILSEE
ncbi:MAG: HrcA family transcriptional regulator, partial [Ruminiclostridium sp.]|nr:HrcA family transcriptional regulator [Ruminiclostridium sp.]